MLCYSIQARVPAIASLHTSISSRTEKLTQALLIVEDTLLVVTASQLTLEASERIVLKASVAFSLSNCQMGHLPVSHRTRYTHRSPNTAKSRW